MRSGEGLPSLEGSGVQRTPDGTPTVPHITGKCTESHRGVAWISSASAHPIKWIEHASPPPALPQYLLTALSISGSQ